MNPLGDAIMAVAILRALGVPDEKIAASWPRRRPAKNEAMKELVRVCRIDAGQRGQPGAEVIRPRRRQLQQPAEVERRAALALAAEEDAGEAGLGLVADHFDLLLVELGQLDRPVDGVLEEADLVDQAVLLGLIGGEDLPGGQLVQCGRSSSNLAGRSGRSP